MTVLSHPNIGENARRVENECFININMINNDNFPEKNEQTTENNYLVMMADFRFCISQIKG